MSQSNYRRESCRLCGSGNLQLALHLEPTPLADSYIPERLLGQPQAVYPLDVALCGDCGFSQVRDVVEPEIIYVDYIYETKSSLGLVDHFKRYADSVVARIHPAAGSLVVDIGSNDGTLLSAFKARGLRVLGVDPARDIARRAMESGIETLAEFFGRDLAKKILSDHGPATIITANNLFANVDDLTAMTEAIRSLLAPHGVFIFESFYMGDLMANMVFDFIYHEHLSCFSVKPLDSFFRRLGMELIDVERVPTKGGSLRYTAQLAGGPRKASPAVASFIAEETARGLQTIQAFRAFDARIQAAKNATLEKLAQVKAAGGSVDGYGASATTTTLIHHFQLTNSVGCIYDDYPAKQHLYCPGSHIPVLPSGQIYVRKPDYVLIFAWRYWKPIVDQHRAFIEQGGKFIVPLPELQVIGA
jgi:SAM-dependent methyltransferase